MTSDDGQDTVLQLNLQTVVRYSFTVVWTEAREHRKILSNILPEKKSQVSTAQAKNQTQADCIVLD